VVVWILLLVYKTGLVEQIDELHPVPNSALLESAVENGAGEGKSDEASWPLKDARDAAEARNTGSTGTVGASSYENQGELWKNLSPNHWPMLFAYYNISLTGRCCSFVFILFCFYKITIMY